MSCKTCKYFNSSLPSFLTEEQADAYKIIGECSNKKVANRFCVSYGTICNGQFYTEITEKIDFKEVLKAILLIKEIEKTPLKELAKQYAEYSNQQITDEMVKEWQMTGLGNEYFLTSDFLQKYGFIPIQFID